MSGGGVRSRPGIAAGGPDFVVPSSEASWKAKLPASVGAPVIADVDGDGASEILVATGDGNLCLLRGRE